MSVYTLFTCSFPEQVPELLPLGLHVALALPVRGRDERHPLGNLDVPVLQPPDLAGIVGEQPDFFHAEMAEDRGPDGIVPRVVPEAELLVRLHGVHALVLQCVRLYLVREPDAPALLLEVDKDAALLADHPERGAELEPAVALRRAERVPGQALGVDARQRRLAPGELPLDEGRVLLLPAVLEDVDAEFSVDGGESRFRFVFYQGCHQR